MRVELEKLQPGEELVPVSRTRGVVVLRLLLSEARELRDELLWTTGDGGSGSQGDRLWALLEAAGIDPPLVAAKVAGLLAAEGLETKPRHPKPGEAAA